MRRPRTLASITRIPKVWQTGATAPSPPVHPSRPTFSEVFVHTRCLLGSPVNTREDLTSAGEATGQRRLTAATPFSEQEERCPFSGHAQGVSQQQGHAHPAENTAPEKVCNVSGPAAEEGQLNTCIQKGAAADSLQRPGCLSVQPQLSPLTNLTSLCKHRAGFWGHKLRSTGCAPLRGL